MGARSDPEGRDDSQRTLAAADQSHQIDRAALARAVFAADVENGAVGQDHLDAEDVIRGYEILERVNSACVGGGVAADGAGPLTGRIRGEMQARASRHGGDGFGKLGIPHARLDVGHTILEIDLQYPVHPRG